MDFKTLLKEHAIALTGGIACGKTTIAKTIEEEGFLVVDADQLAREVLAKGSDGLQRIKRIFGTEYLDDQGHLNRGKLRRLISTSPEARKKLEEITHPLILAATETLLRQQGIMDQPRLWFYEAALIYEVGRQDQFKEVWVACCDRETQVARVMARDSCSHEDAEKVINMQIPAVHKAEMADYAIFTNSPPEIVENQVRLHLKYAVMTP